MRRILSLVGLLAGLGGGAAHAQARVAPVPADAGQGVVGQTAPNPVMEAFKSICLRARAEPVATAKAALAAHWSPIPPIAIPAMGGTAFQDAAGYRAPAAQPGSGGQFGAAAQGVWVIIGRTPMPGFAYLADSCAVFVAPVDASLPEAVRAWAGGAPTVDDPGHQLIQYAFVEGGQTADGGGTTARTLVTDSIDAAAPGLQVGTISLVTVIPGAKRSVLFYSVVNP